MRSQRCSDLVRYPQGVARSPSRQTQSCKYAPPPAIFPLVATADKLRVVMKVQQQQIKNNCLRRCTTTTDTTTTHTKNVPAALYNNNK